MSVTRYLIEKDGERQNVTSLSGYEDWTVLESDVPMIPLEVQRQQRWEGVKAYRDMKRYGGCMTPKGRMDTDAESQRKINGAVTMATIVGPTFTIDWTMEDNTVVTHNQAEIIAAGLAVGQHDAQCHAVGQALRAQLEAGEDIDIEGAVWPG